MTSRPTIGISNGKESIDCHLFTISESLSAWEGKQGIYIYGRLEGDIEEQFLDIIYVGCTLDFSFIKYTSSKNIFEHKPTHICFYEKQNDTLDVHELGKAITEVYHPVLMNKSLSKVKQSH